MKKRIRYFLLKNILEINFKKSNIEKKRLNNMILVNLNLKNDC